MTFREKLTLEHPELVYENYGGGCYGCPRDQGYEANKPCEHGNFIAYDCYACWDRQMPPPHPEEQEVPTAPHEIPQAVRKLVEARIQRITEQVKELAEQIKALEADRDVLCDWLNER